MQNKYDIIYADPAWTFITRGVKGKDRSPEKHYECMTIEDIKALPVNEWTSDNAVLLIWTTDMHLPQALEVIKAWGFEYKTVGFTWVKLLRKWYEVLAKIVLECKIFELFRMFHFGMGYYTRANPEMCLLATKGKPLPRLSHSVRQLVIEPIREHSRKPDCVRDKIVQLFGDRPRLEMFARTKVDGWDVWGNETDKFKS